MSIRTLCLAILLSGDATGYEIKKLSVEGKYRYFADASFGSIYPTLARLETEGLVTLREEVQAGKPPRKIYSITAAGRQALVAALSEPAGPDVFRSGFMLIAVCAGILPRAVITAAVDERLAHLDAEIRHLESIAEASNDAGSRWACDYGVICMRQSREYLETHRSALETAAGSPEAEAPLEAATK